MHEDASRRGNERATLWAVATVIGGLIVPIFGAVGIGVLYVLVGRE